jgi:hypothetical protein
MAGFAVETGSAASSNEYDRAFAWTRYLFAPSRFTKLASRASRWWTLVVLRE